MDGVPGITQPAVASGEAFDYEFVLPDAGTYWYHPHVATYEQVGRGLYGPIIIDEVEPVDVDQDLLLVVSDVLLNQQAQIVQSFQSLHDAAHAGRLGNVLLVNGTRAPFKQMLRPGARIRLRVINASSARIYRLRFRGVQPLIIAIDGHPCPVTPASDSLHFSPGNRFDFIVDVPRESDLPIVLEDEFFPAMRKPLAQFVTDRSLPIPQRSNFIGLPPNPLMVADLKNAEKINLTIEGGALSAKATREAIWLLNGQGNHHSHMDSHTKAPEPTFTVDLGCTVRCMIDNRTAWFHPMHFHGVVLRERLKDGTWGPIKDSTLVWPFSKQEIMFVAESPGDWMIHCHVSEHHHAGLMGTFRVTNLCRSTNNSQPKLIS
jgi:FtsP/CotA-like multicopper oxidase with cupredoxin domain